MPKWDRELRIIDLYNAPCESALWPAAESETDAEILVAAHNADIDALTAERDELQRRLDAVVAKISEAVVSDDDCVCSMLCYSAVIAIAEDE